MDDLREDAVARGVQRRALFAFFRAWARRFLRIFAVSSQTRFTDWTLGFRLLVAFNRGRVGAFVAGVFGCAFRAVLLISVERVFRFFVVGHTGILQGLVGGRC